MFNCTLNCSTAVTPPTTTHSIFFLDICVLSINFLFGLPTHSFIVYFIITGSRIASEFFFLNFSVCEIGICLNSCIIVFKDFLYYKYFSTFSRFLEGFAITGRPLFQCLICVERYLAVVHPVTFLKFKALRHRAVCCAGVWLIILGSCLLCVQFYNLSNIYANTLFFLAQLLVFLSVQIFCCVAVLRALKQSGPGERGREREKNHMKRRAFNIIIIFTIAVAIIYVPYIFSGFVTLHTRTDIHELWSFSLTCFVLAGLVQPVLYLQRNENVLCLLSKFKTFVLFQCVCR